MSMDRIFIDYSIDRLKQHSARIEKRLGELGEDRVWARGADNANAVGNLVLHLCGNVRQWIISGVGGAQDTRIRDREFAAKGGVPIAELRDRLNRTIDESVAVLQKLTPERLLERIHPQNHDVSVLEGVYHVVEHFAWHTGQIVSSSVSSS